MNTQVLENFLQTEFITIRSNQTRNITENRDNLDYFIEACHRYGIQEISEIKQIIPFYYEKVQNLMLELPGKGALSELSNYIAFHNENFRREIYPLDYHLFE
ncbi:hypothetical protein [Leptospira meyeri]|uniref:hypothetical protein n=1 Tax=Leptospira meyeri TaxID=29508 RepID=UPI000CC64821|nr:hypothetical protein [Leptospira meyeri]PJZ79272.1 hypothetical protein CH359_19050 [Leptospira meyeri]PJZ95106.1 hypothetical protein CH358_19010 [Leptospira meyeri]